jgi:exonuclease VII large subunit
VHGCQAAVSRCEVAIQRIHPRSFVARTAERLTEITHRLRWALSQRVARGERALHRWAATLSPTALARQPGLLAERVARLERRMVVAVEHRFQMAAAGVEAEADKLQAISYRATLARGFSITRLKRGRTLVRDVSRLKGGDRLLTETASGEVESTVVDRKQLELFE